MPTQKKAQRKRAKEAKQTKNEVKQNSPDEETNGLMEVPELKEIPGTRKWINVPELLTYLEKGGYSLTDTDVTSFSTEPSSRKPRENAIDSKFIRLTEAELQQAFRKLVTRYPKIETRFIDAVIPPNQTFCNFSFVPAAGAKPDTKGMYGVVKFRGAFATEQDAEAQAVKIIETSDAYHHIHMGLTGHPMPLVTDDNDDFTLEVQSVGLKETLQKEMSEDMKKRREKEKKELDEAKARADTLKKKEEAAIRGEVDEFDQYTTLRVKRANLIFSIYESLKNTKRLKDTLTATITQIENMDAKDSRFAKDVSERYRNACREVGIPDEKNNILRFLVGPIPFDLNIIPDKLPALEVKTDLKFFNEDEVDPRAVARELVIKAKEGRTDFDDVKPDKIILDKSTFEKQNETKE